MAPATLGRIQHDFAVGSVKRRLKECAVDRFEEDIRRDPLRLGEDKAFAERVNHRADEEVSAQFQRVRLARLFADNRDAARERFEDRASTFEVVGRAGGDDPKFAVLGDVGTAEDGSSDEGNARAVRAPG